MWTLIVLAIFAVFPIWIYIKTKLFAKEIAKAPEVSATIISCEKKELDKDEPSVFLVTYEFTEPNGAVCTAEEWQSKSVKVGKTSKKLLIYNKPSGYTLLDLSEREINDGKGGWWLLAISAFILVVGVVFYMAEKNPEIVAYTPYLILPIMAFATTAFSVFSFMCAIRKRLFERDEFTQVIQGEILGYDKRYDGSDDAPKYSYFPIYKYYLNGQECEYHSPYGGSKKRRKGTRVKLYYNSQSQEILERDSVKKDIMIGIVTLSFAAVLWIASYMIWFAEV